MIQWGLLKKPAPLQAALEMVALDSLVPKDHLLRKIDVVIDFSFIHDRVAGLYCPDNGRPPLDPICMFKALFIGYLFGIRSERQLMREIEVNVAYRWFLQLQLTDAVFDASTLSQNRHRRFTGESVARDIFDAIVEQAIGHGLVVAGFCIPTAPISRPMPTRANMIWRWSPNRAPTFGRISTGPLTDRAAHSKPPMQPRPRQPEVKKTKVSRADPDCGYIVRDGKPRGFF